MRIVSITATLAVLLLAGLTLDAQQATQWPGIFRTPLVDNPSAAVNRFTFQPGGREKAHTHPFGVVLIVLSQGDGELLQGTETYTRTLQAGEVYYTEPQESHAWANVGSSPFDVVIVTPRVDRVPGGTAPPLPLPAGITARTALDAPDATVRVVEFGPGARETVHTHPYDLVLVPLASGPMELQLAGKTETKNYGAGDAVFVPRNTPHALANPGKEKRAVSAVVIK